MLLFTLFWGCGETIKVSDNSAYCQEDPQATLIADDADCDGILTADDCDDNDIDSSAIADDADCDGIITEEDCDDSDATSTIIADDGDCDGVPTANDCDDADEASTVMVDDGDCDGVLTADDCDDTNAASTVVANDGDCDGIVTDEDCDDTDETSTAIVDDGDCDGVRTEDDCDDTNAASTVVANDGDCDGFVTADDCDDSDNSIYPQAVDTWYDGIDSDCAGDNDYDQDGDGDAREGDEYCSEGGAQTEEDCSSLGGVWSVGYDCNDNNPNRLSLSNEADPTACYIDGDGDGFGDNELSSSQISSGLTEGSDCNDSISTTFPGAGFNEVSPVSSYCLNDADGDGYAEPIDGECFDFTFSSESFLLGPISSWPTGRKIQVLVDGNIFAARSTAGSTCVEEGKAISFKYYAASLTSGTNLEATVSWERPLTLPVCLAYGYDCYTESEINIVSPSSGLYYWTETVQYVNGQASSSTYTSSYPLVNGTIIFSGTTQGNEDVYGTDSNDSDASTH